MQITIILDSDGNLWIEGRSHERRMGDRKHIPLKSFKKVDRWKGEKCQKKQHVRTSMSKHFKAYIKKTVNNGVDYTHLALN